jgi:hypothetical protein
MDLGVLIFPRQVKVALLINTDEGKPMEKHHFSTGEAARELGLPRWKLSYLVERGDVPAPSVALPGRWVFTQADIERIRQVLAERGADEGR